MPRLWLCCCAFAVLLTISAESFPHVAIASEPASSGPRVDGIEELVTESIAEGNLPGAVVLIGRSNGILHRAAYGSRQVEPEAIAMTLDTVFDLASLTKPTATATSVLLLAEQGKIDITAPVSKYLPEFGQHGKDQITVDQLLTHTSGLIADNSLKDYHDGKQAAWKKICELKLVAPPGEKFIYSDVGFITLGFLVEHVSAKSLNEFTQRNIFRPLGMSETGYLPGDDLRQRAAPTEKRDGHWMRGEVHDPRAYELGGVAGHAGLFSTANDLSKYARMVLGQGAFQGNRVLSEETIERMLTSRPVPGDQVRTWGWDRQTGYSSNRGEGMSEQAIGHGGFTGTGMWIDPQLDLYVIFLSNRLHPDGKGSVNHLIGKIGTLAVEHVKSLEAE